MLKFRQFLMETTAGRTTHGHWHKMRDPVAHFEDHPERHSTEHDVQENHFCSNDYIPVGVGYTDSLLSEAYGDESDVNASVGDKRMVIHSDAAKSRAKSIVVPKHLMKGGTNSAGGEFMGMEKRNKARHLAYGPDSDHEHSGPEHTEPLKPNEITRIHAEHLKEHFGKSEAEQIKAEKAAIARLQEAKHLDSGSTLTSSEKLDTVKQPEERDEEGRHFDAAAVKEPAGHAVYTSGHGATAKHHIVNTCQGQTEGCGGGIDAKGTVDAKNGTCFAPKAESQYTGAAVGRATLSQAKHDPRMTKDFVLAHAHSIRKFGTKNDKKGLRSLVRPDTTSESDHGATPAVVEHLNKQRHAAGKPTIITNAYGKLPGKHNPRLGIHTTWSNVGPKVKPTEEGNKQPGEIKENIGRDKTRIRETISATEANGDHKTDSDGHQIPNKGSYAVISAKRGSQLQKDYEGSAKHTKTWSTGRPTHTLSDKEKAQGDEGHFDGEGNATTPDKAHYGHRTVDGERFDYQKQHIGHPRLVPVGKNKDGTPHMIPTDSRFQDDKHLPKAKDRFKGPNGKVVGHMTMTTPTSSTTNDQHHNAFTHHVDEDTIAHALANGGEHEIDKPEHQIAARGNAYKPRSTEPVDMKKMRKEHKARLAAADPEKLAAARNAPRGRGQPVVTRKSKDA